MVAGRRSDRSRGAPDTVRCRLHIMTTDPTENPRSAAVEQLQQLGLSTYAARTFVALVGLGTGTAQEVSEVSEVPRTRVYDAVDELHERGLVDIQQSTPREFHPVSVETAGRTFQREFQRRAELLTTALDAFEPPDRSDEQRGVWTVEGRRAVTDRVLEFFADAEEEIVYMTIEDLLTDDVLEGLRAAADRDVSIAFAGLSPSVRERLMETVPEAGTFDSLWLPSDIPAGRLLMVDETRTLVSVRTNGVDVPDSSPRFETAIWGSGQRNSLVVVLRAMFTWQRSAQGGDGDG
jgi:predicted transcriptional regulator